MRTPSKRNMNSTFRHNTAISRSPISNRKDFNKTIGKMDMISLPKPKERIFILPQIQDIYAKLNFNNNYEAFSEEDILDNKGNIKPLLNKLKKRTQENRCLIHEHQTLNLYCEKDKQLLCVLCAYGDSIHKEKNHNVVPIDKIKPILFEQVQRLKTKLRNIIDKLRDWEIRLQQKIVQLGETTQVISSTTTNLLDIIIQQAQKAKVDFSKNFMQNKTRVFRLLQSYAREIQVAKNTYQNELVQCSKLKLADELNLLKILTNNIYVAQKLVKKTQETIGVIPLWKQIKQLLQKLKQKYDVQTKIIHQKQILVTQF